MCFNLIAYLGEKCLLLTLPVPRPPVTIIGYEHTCRWREELLMVYHVLSGNLPRLEGEAADEPWALSSLPIGASSPT